MIKKAIPHEEIKQLLEKRDIKFADIAKAKKVSLSLVSTVSQRKSQSKRIAEAISLCLNLPLYEVFGDVETYFNPNKRGPKDRTQRTNQIITALREKQPIPPAHNSLSVAS
ncbi:hypothetical protein [Pseudoalteromonas prydzensis]|uniref:hypothetical protein n=1 Tax=Pseudoalteromonas prydzensis TaxID=182141 RepID=UPI0024BCBEE4|nr:hypothetical protein [Pseudoalteromonas prydzensis]